MSVPLSLHSPNKSLLADILTKNVLTPPIVTLHRPSCLIIDSQTLVMALGKHPTISTFGEYANTFAAAVYKMGATFKRIDVVFDQHIDQNQLFSIFYFPPTDTTCQYNLYRYYVVYMLLFHCYCYLLSCIHCTHKFLGTFCTLVM